LIQRGFNSAFFYALPNLRLNFLLTAVYVLFIVQYKTNNIC